PLLARRPVREAVPGPPTARRAQDHGHPHDTPAARVQGGQRPERQVQYVFRPPAFRHSSTPDDLTANLGFAEDGMEMNLDCEKLGIKSLTEEVDRHSRKLQKQVDLADG